MIGRPKSVADLRALAQRHAAAADQHRASAEVQLRQGRRDLAEEALHRANMAELWQQKLLAEMEAMTASDNLPVDPAQLAAECRRLNLEVANLRLALESNRRISMAIGMLMCRYQMTSHQAFAALRRASQNGHRKLNDIAESVLSLGHLPEDTGIGPADAAAGRRLD